MPLAFDKIIVTIGRHVFITSYRYFLIDIHIMVRYSCFCRNSEPTADGRPLPVTKTNNYLGLPCRDAVFSRIIGWHHMSRRRKHEGWQERVAGVASPLFQLIISSPNTTWPDSCVLSKIGLGRRIFLGTENFFLQPTFFPF